MNGEDENDFLYGKYEDLEGYDLTDFYVMIGDKCLIREILHDKEHV